MLLVLGDWPLARPPLVVVERASGGALEEAKAPGGFSGWNDTGAPGSP